MLPSSPNTCWKFNQKHNAVPSLLFINFIYPSHLHKYGRRDIKRSNSSVSVSDGRGICISRTKRSNKSHFFWLIFVFSSIIFSHGRSLSLSLQPHAPKSFNPKNIQAAKSCPYTFVIKTSCSSTTYTRDKISLAFGDSYGNEVYIKRLDDPSSGTFERCSTDTFQINGPCVYDICYLYMLRTGYDGWKPESVKIYAPYTRTVKFNYNKFLPNGVWYGFNVCVRASLSTAIM